jgi:hypothetical protein
VATSREAIERWARWRVFRETEARYRVIVPDANRLIASETANEIYSYGHHFPLVRWVPAKRGRGGLFVINGDVWPNRGWTVTPTHQADTRDVVDLLISEAAARGIKIAKCVIPFTALNGARIDIDSIRPVAVNADTRDVFVHTVTLPPDTFGALPMRPDYGANANAPDSVVQRREITATVQTTGDANGMARAGVPATDTRQIEVSRTVYFRESDYSGGQYRGKRECDPPHVYHGIGRYGEGKGTAQPDGSVVLKWETTRHWLGECVFTGTVAAMCRKCRGAGVDRSRDDLPNDWQNDRGRPHCPRCKGRGTIAKRRRFVSSFDYNEPAPLYFLAALPNASRARSVEWAIDDLAPAAVHAARARGAKVLRQGDIFFVPTSYTDDDIAARANTMARLTQWTRNARAKRGEVGYVAPLTAAQRREMAALRLRLYREYRAYSLAHVKAPQTPHGYRAARRRLVASAARELTAPAPAHSTDNSYRIRRTADALASYDRDGRAAKRMTGYAHGATSIPHSRDYGKCYNRALSAWRQACAKSREAFAPDVDMAQVRAALAIHGTGHTATVVATCDGGTMYARGTVRHVPEIAQERRAPDHRPLVLEDGVWYLAIRNTVPRQ